MTIKQSSGVSVKADSFNSLLSSFFYSNSFAGSTTKEILFTSFGSPGFSHHSLHPSPLRPLGYFSFLQPARCEGLFFSPSQERKRGGECFNTS